MKSHPVKLAAALGLAAGVAVGWWVGRPRPTPAQPPPPVARTAPVAPPDLAPVRAELAGLRALLETHMAHPTAAPMLPQTPAPVQ